MKGKIQICTLLIIVFSVNCYCQNENSLSSKDKIYGLSLIWKEVSYNFAFFNQIPDLNWDSCYQDFIPRVLDGHTRVFTPVHLRNKYYGTSIKQLNTKLIEGKVIITRVLDDSLRIRGMKPGMEIVAINEMNPFIYAEQYVAPYVYASTPHDRQLQIFSQNLLSGRVAEPVRIEVKDFDGKVERYSIYREPWIMEEEMLTGKPLEFKVVAKNTGYLKINNFVGSNSIRSDFDSIYEKILLTDALIIDVRENMGGWTDISQYILKHFANKPFKTGKWRSPENIAAHRSWGSNIEWFESGEYEVAPFTDKVIYTRPIVLLADESTFSCAEDFCADFLTMKRGKIVGSKTAGSSGNPLMVKLPGEGVALICTKQDFFPDGREYVGFGIDPDIEVKPSIEDIFQNNDPVLQAAIKTILQ